MLRSIARRLSAAMVRPVRSHSSQANSTQATRVKETFWERVSPNTAVALGTGLISGVTIGGVMLLKVDLARIGERLDKTDELLGKTDEKVDKLDQKLDNLANAIHELATEVHQLGDSVDRFLSRRESQ